MNWMFREGDSVLHLPASLSFPVTSMAKIIFSKLMFFGWLLYCASTVSILIMAGPTEKSPSFNFTEFGSDETDEIYFVSDATVSDDVVHLTNSTSLKYTDIGNQTAGRIVYKKTIQLSSIAHFSTHFQFAMYYSGGDGIAFFMASIGDALTVPQFTTRDWFGLAGDGRSDFFAVAFASMDMAVGTFVKNSYNDYLRKSEFYGLNNGALWDAWIDYNSPETMLRVYLTNGSHSRKSPQNCILSQSVDLSEYLTENIVIGFSSAAVNSTETHDIFSWSFNSSLYPKNISIGSSSIHNSNSDGKGRKKVSTFTKIILSVGSGVVVCIAGVLLIWGYFSFVRRKRIAFISRQKLPDMELDNLLHHIPRRFNMADLIAGTNNFSETRKLGQGGFGGVYKCILLQKNEILAVKRISEGSRQGIKEFMTEVSIVSRLRHRNLVPLLGWCHERDQLLLVYEYMPNGSLDRHLFRRGVAVEEVEDHPVLQWSVRYKIAREIASALLYLHEEWDQCVVHRDVKPSNVMLDSNFSAKLGDFGLARMLNREGLAQTTRVAGTLGYLAPECVVSGKTSPESDVYSFGAVALEIALGKQAVDLSLLEFHMRLVVWAWDLYGRGRVLEAADVRLNGEFEKIEMEQLIVVGLWCSHPDAAARPKMKHVLRLLNFEVTAPRLPTTMPVASYAETSLMTGPSPSVSSTSVSAGVTSTSPQA